MPSRQWLAVLLTGVMLILAPMAMASPPDPSWLGGLWDNGDLDDVVLHVTNSTSVLQPISLSSLVVPLSLARSTVRLSADVLIAGHVVSAVASRAPPSNH